MKNQDPKALLSFMYASDADIATLTARVINGVTGNANLPSAQNVAKELVPALADFSKLLSDALGGSRVQIEAKNIQRKALLDLLREGCRMVNFDANGDRLKLLSSGYGITGETKKSSTAKVHELKAA